MSAPAPSEPPPPLGSRPTSEFETQTEQAFSAPTPFAFSHQEVAGDREMFDRRSPTFGMPPLARSSSSGPADAQGGESSGDGGGARGSAGDTLTVRIVSTSNALEDEPWLPVKTIVTMFRISVTTSEKQWEVLRRFNDFHELHMLLSRSYDRLPALPPKLLLNDDQSIAERYLELDVYLRKLVEPDSQVRRHAKLLEFLGVEKQGVRYGMRRYEYDSAQSEGNRYIRDNDL